MALNRDNRTVKVGLVAVPQTAPAVLYSLLEIFASVGTVWEELTGKPGSSVRMEPKVIADAHGLIRCGMGMPVLADATFESGDSYDVAITTDMLLPPEFDPPGQWPAAAEWVRFQDEGGAIIASVCTGGILLGEAGLLDELEATSHWAAVRLFHQFYPKVRLTPEKVLVLAGPEHRIVTAGGAASWVELACT